MVPMPAVRWDNGPYQAEAMNKELSAGSSTLPYRVMDLKISGLWLGRLIMHPTHHQYEA
mgnify:CR=1 FL=1